LRERREASFASAVQARSGKVGVHCAAQSRTWIAKLAEENVG
jgi:hypothetical protein